MRHFGVSKGTMPDLDDDEDDFDEDDEDQQEPDLDQLLEPDGPSSQGA